MRHIQLQLNLDLKLYLFCAIRNDGQPLPSLSSEFRFVKNLRCLLKQSYVMLFSASHTLTTVRVCNQASWPAARERRKQSAFFRHE